MNKMGKNNNNISIKSSYLEKKHLLKQRLNNFQLLPKKDRYYELIFCLLTPQSKAQKCWQAVEEMKNLKRLNYKSINKILKTKTRFHNNKTKYVLESKDVWNDIKPQLNNKNIIELRNWLANNVKGLGLKEASHFLRNIGLSNNNIAILDRHIIKNLKQNKIMNEDKIKNNKHYLEIENAYLKFANSLKIPADELDLLFWSNENGDIFK